MKRLLAYFLSACLVATALTGCSGGASSGAAGGAEQNTDAVDILLSDSGVTVEGKAASTDPAEAVYVGADIVYYEEGHDESYGEGEAADEHTAAEAGAHTVVTITRPGVYRVSGKLSAGQLAVDLGEDADEDPSAVVELILDGVDITCTVAPAVIFYHVYESGSTETAGAVVTLADGSDNRVNGAYVARIYKEGTTDKLHKYDGAFYSRMSMLLQGGELGTGTLEITASNEGLDSEMHLTLNGGTVRIYAQNDGINTNEDGVSVTTINGGYLYIDAGNGAEGDGIDSNGALVINGGTVIALANGRSGDGGIDADMDIVINGGTVLAAGSRNDTVSSESAQFFMELSYSALESAGSIIRLTDAQGAEIFTFAPAKAYQSFTFSSPELQEDTVYFLYSGGSVSGAEAVDGLYAPGGAYSGGVQQQYTGTGGFGGMGGGARPQGERPEGFAPPKGAADTASEPDATEQRPTPPADGGRPGGAGMPEGMTPPHGMDGSGTAGESREPSAEFILTASAHSFSGISDVARDSGKTAVTFHVNDNDEIADTEGGAPVVVYAGASVEGQAVYDLSESDIQITVVDQPSEDYSKTALLSEGSEALAGILPADAGTYLLTIAVLDTNEAYTGSTSFHFTIR